MIPKCCKCGTVCIFCVALITDKLSSEKYNDGHDCAKNGGSIKDNPFRIYADREFYIAWKNGFKSFKRKS